MMRIASVLAMFADLREPELTVWIERGWVVPESADSGWVFQDIDIARVRLIHDLRRRMDVNDDAIPLILSLLDQIHDLRGQLRAVLQAVGKQPEAVRRAILADL